MRNKLFIASIIGSVAYIINILVGLFLFHPLVNVLKHGIISFVIIFIFSYIVIYLIEVVRRSNNLQKNKKEEQKNKKEQTVVNENNDSEDIEDEFSPMEPPVVEYEEKKES